MPAIQAHRPMAVFPYLYCASSGGCLIASLTALKSNDTAKRFVEELNRAEDQLQAAHKQTTELEQQKQAAVAELNKLIAAVSFDWDVKTN